MNPIHLIRSLVFAATLLLQLLTSPPDIHAAPGDVDLSFDPGSSVNGTVNAVVVQGDGKVIIGGEFTTVGGLTRHRLARLNADGTGDSSFAPAAFLTNPVYSLVLQGNGKVLVGHEGSSYGLTRLNADGTPDTAFNNNSEAAIASTEPFYPARVTALLVQPDGKVLYGGESLLRLNADGTLDNTFRSGAVGWVYSIAQQADGKLIVGGYFHDAATNVSSYGLVRLNSDGSIDNTFDRAAGQDGIYWSIVPQPDGKVLVGGQFLGSNNTGIARMNSNGTVDPTFAPVTGVARAIALQADGRVIIGGSFTFPGDASKTLARLNANGSLDLSFAGGVGGTGDRSVRAVALAGDGNVVAAGAFTTANGIGRNRVARFHSDGSLDLSFDPGAGLRSKVSSVVVQSDGNVLIAGGINALHGTNMVGLARLTANGSRDGSFLADFGTTDVLSVSLQADEKILVGVATVPGGSVVGRLHSDGSGDDNFRPDLDALVQYDEVPDGFSGEKRIVVTATMAQAGGKVLVAGYTLLAFSDGSGFHSATVRSFLARLQSDGTADASFTPVIGNQMEFNGYFFGWRQYPKSALAVQPDGKIYYAGFFDALNGTSRKAIARLHPNGAVDTSFNLGILAADALAMQPDGKLLVGGILPPIYDRGIFRLNADGTLDSGFNTRISEFHRVESVGLQADGRVVIGGSFNAVNGTTRNHVARLNANGTVDGTFNPGAGPNEPVAALALQADGHMLIAGGFTGVSGITRPSIARLLGNDDVVPPGAEIAVEQPAGTNLIDGTASVSFGITAPGILSDRTFTIRNIGGLELNGISVTIEGANASSFAIAVQPAGAVNGPNGTTTFTVRFAPQTIGTHTATLHLFSNDADESPFDIALMGAAENGSPTAAADSAMTAYVTAVDIHVLANDSDPDGHVLTITAASGAAHGTTQIVTTSSGLRVRYMPSGGFSGTDTFTYSISDNFGGSATASVTVTVKPRGKKTISKGAVVTGAGEPSSGVPAGAMWKTFGIPSVASDGTTAFGATITTVEGLLPVIYRGSSDEEPPAGAEHAVASKGDVAPGVDGATFGSFKDPLANDDGTIVFVATLRSPAGSAKGGIWKHYPGQGNGGSTLVMQLGGEPAGVPGALWKTVTSVAVSDGVAGDETIAFTATMAPGAGGVRASSDAGLWLVNANGIALALREGATVMIGATPMTLKNFVALQALPGAAGQGHGVTPAGVLARVKFHDGSHAIVRAWLDENGLGLSAIALAGEAPAGLNANLATFGLPTQSRAAHACFIATLSPAARESDTAIFHSDGSDLEVVAREGDQALVTDTARFSTFAGLAIDSAGRIAFSAALRGGTANAGNNTAIFHQVGSMREVIARKGEQAAGVAAGGKWGSFPSIALRDGGEGPIFIAKLVVPGPGEPNPAGIGGGNNTGVWAADSTGTLQLIVRTGESFDAQRKITGLALLSSVLCSSSQARSFTDAGDLIYRATLSDRSQQIVRVQLP